MGDFGPQLLSQPPPLPGRAWKSWALALGAADYVAVLYRFQTYNERNAVSTLTFVLFSVVMFLSGVVLGWFAATSFARSGTFLILGVFAAHFVVVVVDCEKDPTDHNLLPFEFIIYFVLGAPAYAGTLISRVARRLGG